MRNIRHIACAVALVSALLAPSATMAVTAAELNAQIASLMQQISVLQTRLATNPSQSVAPIPQVVAPTTGAQTSPAVTQPWCPTFTHNQSRGSTGTEVLFLQRYLLSQGLLTADALTSTFDARTETALQAWQAKYNIISSGSPSTTGWGALGPRTIKLIGLNCSVQTVKAPVTPTSYQDACRPAIRPSVSCSGSWAAVSDANGCTKYWECTVALPTAPIVPSVPTSTLPAKAPNSCVSYPRPTTACSGAWRALTDYYGCTTAWQCL